VPFFVLARARGIPCHYIESATRVTGPSLTARLLERVPGVQLYSQQSSWERQGWQYRGSVFDTFESGPRREGEIRKVVVTVGTSQRYGFRRLIERLHAILPSEASVLWQTGSTDTDGLGLEASPYLGVEELSAAMSDADLVVAHAGVGSALTALRAGRCPVLVPRRQSHGEHVDDHQWEVAAALSSRGVAISVAVETLTLDDLREAASRSVVSSEVAAPYVLAGS
jgi:UDP-N-acetylglucosamine transferase subunit ALG13